MLNIADNDSVIKLVWSSDEPNNEDPITLNLNNMSDPSPSYNRGCYYVNMSRGDSDDESIGFEGTVEMIGAQETDGGVEQVDSIVAAATMDIQVTIEADTENEKLESDDDNGIMRLIYSNLDKKTRKLGIKKLKQAFMNAERYMSYWFGCEIVMMQTTNAPRTNQKVSALDYKFAPAEDQSDEEVWLKKVIPDEEDVPIMVSHRARRALQNAMPPLVVGEI
jgi:hypothetical protein